jgi:hypothetical protein
MSASYPEHERLQEVKLEVYAICSFRRWLEHKHLRLMYINTDQPAMMTPEALAAEFYDIDREELNAEKDRMVEALRLINEPTIDPKA